MTGLFSLSKRFDSLALDYPKYAVMPVAAGERLLARLQYLKITPNLVLDLGCGLGQTTKSLQKLYPRSRVVGVDISPGMLHAVKKSSKWSFKAKPDWLVADVMNLPLLAESVDLIFANQVLQWLPDAQRFFLECSRILKPGGCLLFSTVGPDTFKEFRYAFAQVDHDHHTHEFDDLHDLGDLLLSQSFTDPVMDREDLVLRYREQHTLLRALRAQGVHNDHAKRVQHLMTPRQWQHMWQCYPRFEDKLPLTYELIYGQAWKTQPVLHKVSLKTLREKLKEEL